MKALPALLLIAFVAGASSAADRRWQTGTLVDAGIKRTALVGDPVRERMPPVFNRPQLTEVATYVIETDNERFHLQDMVPIGQGTFDVGVKVGTAVTFAVEKKTAYVRKADGSEYRLLVIKREQKKKSR